MPRPDGASDDPDPSDARQRLLAAARDELVEHGVNGISLRGIGRRAGVSRAAPQYFFGDRAGLLTAIAAEGFVQLTERLRAVVDGAGDRGDLEALGRAYVRFGLDHPALFELMFRPDELHPEDPTLQRVQAESIGVLVAATAGTGVTTSLPEDLPPAMALMSWAFAHGLVTLIRQGALRHPGTDATAVADELVRVFGRVVSTSTP